MGKRRIMRALKILEISSVDRPACEFARVAIIKRADDEVEGKSGFGTSNEGARARLRLLIEHQRRSRPAFSEAEAVAAGWGALGYADRNALLAEDDNGQDPTFDPENADVQSGQLDKRAARTAAIAKANYAFHAVNVLAKQLCEEDPRMTIEKARVEARRLNPEWARKEREARLEAASA
jgi:hypothetical protein